MIFFMTGQGEKEENICENDESRGSENEESRGNVREEAGKKKKDVKKKSVQQKEGKRVSGEGLSCGKTVEVGDRREMGHSV